MNLMHGEIKLESELGQGTKTTFWIPFHKAHIEAGDFPLVDLGSAHWSASGESSGRDSVSEDRSRINMAESLGHTPLSSKDMTASDSAVPPRLAKITTKAREDEISSLEIDRKDIHILVVEDK